MDIYVDNELYSPPESPAATIDQLIEQIKPRLSERDRIIVSIQCDHKQLAENEIAEVMTHDVSRYGRLDFTTATVPDLAVGALEAARSILGQTRPKQEEVIELLSRDQNDKAVTALADCIAGWSQAHDAVVNTISLIGLDIEKLAYEDKKLCDFLNDVAHQLTQLKDCLAAGDYVLLNDLLQYEIAPWFEQWEGMVESILTEVRELASS